ncbi:transposase [Roseomonas stagni]|uniref:Transposase n=1 Tax=Falsiroseomonas algicola TaxID=2716930 RepID=A0A6M1LVQ7_9PROT|nr:transposase [Falsiroseomonas algicola]NGM23554.1 transposase [Falsiroseomonas algicola]
MLPLRPTPSHPWSPLTDAERHVLEPYLLPQKPKTGRPPRNRRAIWDAIF